MRFIAPRFSAHHEATSQIMHQARASSSLCGKGNRRLHFEQSIDMDFSPQDVVDSRADLQA
jgi:hypothetical protein